MIRCAAGEAPASKGFDGALTVDVSAVQTLPARKWDGSWDGGRGNRNTIVYPVKATFTTRQFFRIRTTIEADKTMIFNFYVNDSAEWAIGFRELVKPSSSSVIPRR
jgi:hypothetical protein